MYSAASLDVRLRYEIRIKWTNVMAPLVDKSNELSNGGDRIERYKIAAELPELGARGKRARIF